MNITCSDFYETNDREGIEDVLRPIINDFVRHGYHNVPDWQKLADEMREQIRKNGWGQMDVKEVAEKAARQLGIS